MRWRFWAAWALLAVSLAVAVWLGQEPEKAPPLPALAVDAQSVTLSGTSSGGYFAVQVHMAAADVFRGLAAISAGPYYCSRGDGKRFMADCMVPAAPDVPDRAFLQRHAEQRAAAGAIAALPHLQQSKVFIAYGLKDQIVSPQVSKVLLAIYQSWVPSANIQVQELPAAGHGWYSPYGDQPCEAMGGSMMNRCDGDLPGQVLAFFYGALQPKREAAQLRGQLRRFDQSEFFADGRPELRSNAGSGWVYIPQDCVDRAGCRLHLVLHGCTQGIDILGDRFPRMAGLNEWADSNRIVVVYPQAVRSRRLENSAGCWDVWGYNGANFAERTAPQIQLMLALVARLTAKPAAMPPAM